VVRAQKAEVGIEALMSLKRDSLMSLSLVEAQKIRWLPQHLADCVHVRHRTGAAPAIRGLDVKSGHPVSHPRLPLHRREAEEAPVRGQNQHQNVRAILAAAVKSAHPKLSPRTLLDLRLTGDFRRRRGSRVWTRGFEYEPGRD
jgi:hypothetical protein